MEFIEIVSAIWVLLAVVMGARVMHDSWHRWQ